MPLPKSDPCYSSDPEPPLQLFAANTAESGCMAKGSQLKQLKAELNNAGFSRRQQTGALKQLKRSVNMEEDRDRKLARLAAIHEQFNPFDTKVTKLKYDIGGRKIKGVVGKPSSSKQAGVELVRISTHEVWILTPRSSGGKHCWSNMTSGTRLEVSLIDALAKMTPI